eukprot:scaffold249884_cov26-Tisochrysis_lutea.AAC.4
MRWCCRCRSFIKNQWPREGAFLCVARRRKAIGGKRAVVSQHAAAAESRAEAAGAPTVVHAV